MTTTLKKLALSGVVLSGVMAVSTFAAAQPTCSSARDARSFSQGILLGTSATFNAFNSTGVSEDPDKLEEFENAVLGALISAIPPTFPSNFVACRVQGMIVGSVNEIARLQDEVLLQCLFDGDFFGDFSANLYCGTMEALSNPNPAAVPIVIPRAPVGLCGEEFQVACEFAFDNVALDQIGYRTSCYPFSTAAFFDMYETTLLNQCTYTPAI